MVKYIPIQGSKKSATVDDDKYERLSQYDWFMFDGQVATMFKGHVVFMAAMVMQDEMGTSDDELWLVGVR